MTVPGFQDFMLPLLRLAADGEQHTQKEAVVALANDFALTEEDRSELLASGTQTKLANRVGWARSYLKAARLIESASRGVFSITDRGLGVLREPPERIDIRFLDRYPEFVEFRTPKNPVEGVDATPADEQTPEDLFESSFRAFRESLAAELLARLRTVSPSFFERLVVDLLVQMGYGGSREDAGRAIGRSGDGGIDGIIKEDRLGLDTVCIQAKRWEASVGRPVVQAFAGSLEGQRARKGVLITTSTFSKEAHDYVAHIEKRIVLIDGPGLAHHMINHGVGLEEVATYTLARLDEDYFDEDASPAVPTSKTSRPNDLKGDAGTWS